MGEIERERSVLSSFLIPSLVRFRHPYIVGTGGHLYHPSHLFTPHGICYVMAHAMCGTVHISRGGHCRDHLRQKEREREIHFHAKSRPARGFPPSERGFSIAA